MAIKTSVKEKRSFTLSRPSVTYLERLRKQRKANSVSQVLDDLIGEARERQKREAAERKITEFYSTRSASEEAESEAWGRFVETHMAIED